MRLKTLTLFGFKSFADKTVITFCPGISAIVGPNGCGKSNIVDAFRWVLGEQSAKSMRGSKMQDFIFSGTANRPALNFAEVNLTFTEVEGVLPIEFEELCLTRRVYRNGESEFLINQRSVRLKDVHDLFLNSGMGKNAFTIFEQGKMDQIIQAAPLERRQIFEEVAGIARFLQRKKEALHKLEEVEANLLRLMDIFEEVKSQVTVLEQQAERAHLYKQEKERLDHLERKLAVLKWLQVTKRRTQLLEEERSLHLQLGNLHKRAEEMEQQVQKVKEGVIAKEKILRQQQEGLYQLRGECEIQKRNLTSSEERQQELTLKQKRAESELQELLQRQQQNELQIKALNEKQTIAQSNLCELQKQLEMKQEAFQQSEHSFLKLQTEDDEFNKSYIRLQQQIQKLESELQQASIRLNFIAERMAEIIFRKTKLVGDREATIQALKEDEAKRLPILQMLSSQQEAFEHLKEAEKQIKKQLQEKQEAIYQLNNNRTAVAARHQALIRLKEEHEGFSKSSKVILKEASQSSSPLHEKVKTLSEAITNSSERQTMMTEVLKSYSQTLVVKNKEDLALLLTFAAQKQLKDFSVLCLELLSSPVDEHFLSPIVTFSTWEEIFSALQHSSSTSMHTFYADGIFVDPSRVFFCHSTAENSPFRRAMEIKELAAQLVDLNAAHDKYEKGREELQKKLEVIQTERSAHEKSVPLLELSKMKLTMEIDQRQKAAQKMDEELTLLLSEQQRLEQDRIQIEASEKEVSTFLNQYKSQKQALQTELEKRRSQVNEWQLSMRQLQQELKKQERDYLEKKDETLKQQHQIALLESRVQDQVQRKVKLQEETQENVTLLTLLQQQYKETEKVLHDMELARSTLHQEALKGEEECKKCKEILEQEIGAAMRQQKQIREVEDELNRLQVKKDQLVQLLAAVRNEFFEQYQITLEEQQAALFPPGTNIEIHSDSIEKQIRLLRPKLEAIDGINMASIEAFQQTTQRYKFLEEQISDLERSKLELAKIIAELDSDSSRRFTETFQKIRTNFKKNFSLLFNGGEADLFCDNDNPLQAGIEIMAKPPGKQTRSLSLLSGGERCLTAMALLFSFFEVKPAPFCILDEIDAPLDESNVDRFMNMVKVFAQTSQFIVVTHNKRTMALADLLCGISMQERGVSKVLSVQLEEKKVLHAL